MQLIRSLLPFPSRSLEKLHASKVLFRRRVRWVRLSLRNCGLYK